MGTTRSVPEATWQNLLEADVVVFVPRDLASDWRLPLEVFQGNVPWEVILFSLSLRKGSFLVCGVSE